MLDVVRDEPANPTVGPAFTSSFSIARAMSSNSPPSATVENSCVTFHSSHTGKPANRRVLQGVPGSLAQHLPEQHPGLAVEARHLQLTDGSDLIRRGIDPDARQQHRNCDVMQRLRLFDKIFARDVVAEATSLSAASCAKT